MRFIGIILIVWGVADVGLSWTGTDIYWEIGINLPEVIYPFTHWVAIGIGYAIYSVGSQE